jgi:hypothetical protein
MTTTDDAAKLAEIDQKIWACTVERLAWIMELIDLLHLQYDAGPYKGNADTLRAIELLERAKRGYELSWSSLVHNLGQEVNLCYFAYSFLSRAVDLIQGRRKKRTRRCQSPKRHKP